MSRKQLNARVTTRALEEDNMFVLGGEVKSLTGGATKFQALASVGNGSNANVDCFMSNPSNCKYDLLNVWIDNDPGAGETCVITFMQQNTPTALSVSFPNIAGNNASDAVNSVTVAPGDSTSIQIVNSAGSGTTRVWFGVRGKVL